MQDERRKFTPPHAFFTGADVLTRDHAEYLARYFAPMPGYWVEFTVVQFNDVPLTKGQRITIAHSAQSGLMVFVNSEQRPDLITVLTNPSRLEPGVHIMHADPPRYDPKLAKREDAEAQSWS